MLVFFSLHTKQFKRIVVAAVQKKERIYSQTALHSNSFTCIKTIVQPNRNKFSTDSSRVRSNWIDIETTASATPTKNNYLYTTEKKSQQRANIAKRRARFRERTKDRQRPKSRNTERHVSVLFSTWHFMYFYLFCTISPIEKFHKANRIIYSEWTKIGTSL